MQSPLRFARFMLILLCLTHQVEAQGILQFFRFVCPIFKLFNLELNFCKRNIKPTPPVKPPVKAPVAPAPTPVAPVAPKAPAPAPVAPAAPKAPAAPAAPAAPSVPDAPRVPVVQAPVAAPFNVNAPMALPPPVVINLPTPLFTLLNFPNKFNAVGAGPICITVANRNFTTVTADVSLKLNGNTIPVTSLSLSQVCSTNTLVDGKNTIALATKDPEGFPLSYTTSVWAGTRSIVVNLVNEAGARFTENTVVTATLSDDNLVRGTQSTSTGTTTFANLPDRTVVFTALSTGSVVSSGNAAGTGGTTNVVTIVMAGFLPPSPIKNNDLSLCTTEGWTFDTDAAVTIINHVKSPGPKSTRRLEENRGNENRQLQAAGTNCDISMITRRIKGETKLSRAFATRPGVTGVLVRYRFVTNEIPEWFNSKYNDYYRVSIRSTQASGAISRTNTMNGLGLASFDIPTKATNWFRATLPISVSGDVVQVDATVANVEDEKFQSTIVLDYIEEVTQSLCIYSNVADGVGTPAFASGHVALLIANDNNVGSPAAVTTYGLWPDNYLNGTSLNNGAASDVRVNLALDDYKSGYPYMFCEMVTDREVADFLVEVAKPVTFTCNDNAADFASGLFKLITGITVNAADLSGLATARKVGQSIRTLNGGANQPPGGFAWTSRRMRALRASHRASIVMDQDTHRFLQLNSSGTCNI